MPGRINCKFHDCLSMIPDALKWADNQNVDGLRSFFAEDPQKPLYCFASGGSFSPVDYAALLYEKYQGMAKAISPLSMSAVSDAALRTAKILLMTSHGDLDANYVARRAAKVNPTNTCAIVREEYDNDVVKVLRKANSRWFAYDWLSQEKPFIATVDTVCKFGLFYKAFTNGGNILGKLNICTKTSPCFTYSPRGEGNIPELRNIRNYIVLYNGWSRPVACDFESKMVESGIASVQLCDYRNWCHGRFIFLSKHLEDSALVLFLTPMEQEFVKDLIEGVSWRDKTDIFPKNTPVIRVETENDSPLASIDLLVKMYVLFDSIAQANDEEPCSPKNPARIDKRFPKNTKFKGLL